jgi:hypothetical protein
MARDPDAFADMVVMTIKAAMAPVLERLAATEQHNRELQARLSELSGVRDRITMMEAKAAQAVEPPVVDLSPMLERLAATEARIAVLGDVRDRVVVMETKAHELSVSQDVPEAGPSGPTMVEIDVAMRDKLDPLAKELSAIRERLVTVEVRQPIPGPPGQDGKDGKDGLNGKDGADGLGWDDFEEVLEDDGRTLIRRHFKGDKVKQFVHKTAVQLYRGVYAEGKTYERGDGVTWGGSEWHCNETTTTKPGDGSKAWTLKVKRGRDGKDGRDGGPPPVVRVDGGR